MRVQIAKCGHFWFHKGCEVCKEIERICEEEFKKLGVDDD